MAQAGRIAKLAGERFSDHENLTKEQRWSALRHGDKANQIRMRYAANIAKSGIKGAKVTDEYNGHAIYSLDERAQNTQVSRRVYMGLNGG